jgi:hypothetical protein
MTPHKTIAEIPTGREAVIAFRISGEIDAEGMERMAQRMNDAFDRFKQVNMLLLFARSDGVTTGASVNFDGLKAQFRALRRVHRYAVVGAPDTAARMIDLFDKVLPVEARAFDLDEEQAAWQFVGAEARNS